MRTNGWKRWTITGLGFLVLLAATTFGCAAVNELAALRQVEFRFDRVSDPEIAGLPLSRLTSYEQLSLLDVGRLAVAIAAKDVPLDLTVHLEGKNPETNNTTARMVKLDWSYLVDENEVFAGQVAQEIVFPPGDPRDLPLGVRFNLVDVFGSDGKALFDTALVLSGQRTSTKKVTLRLMPTIETALGPIRYPVPLTLDLASGR